MIIFDTETTGLPLPSIADLSQQPHIIDFAAIKLAQVERTVRRKIHLVWEEVDRFQTLINPGVPLEAVITKLTGYTDSDLKDAPSFAQALDGIANFVLGQRSMLAHNLPFDKSMLMFELERLGMVTQFPWPMKQLCAVQLYEPEFGKRPRLIQLYEAKLGKPLEQKHTAMADAEALTEIVMKEELYALE